MAYPQETLESPFTLCCNVSGQLAEKQGDNHLTITVHGNDIEKALRELKRSVQRDGILKEIKKRRYYEKPSVKRKRKQVEAERRRRKAQRFKRRDRD